MNIFAEHWKSQQLLEWITVDNGYDTDTADTPLMFCWHERFHWLGIAIFDQKILINQPEDPEKTKRQKDYYVKYNLFFSGGDYMMLG